MTLDFSLHNASETIRQGAEALEAPLLPSALEQLGALLALLVEWNERMNLTAIRDPKDMAIKHVLDSLTCLKAHKFPLNARIVDVGAGAGFPGLVLKMARPDLRLLLIDSTRKKLAFIDHVIETMGWPDVHTLSLRAEEAGQMPEYRETFDVVVARAVAAMPALSEFCLPLARVGGTFLAMKGPNLEEETQRALSAINMLGGQPGAVVPFSLPFDGGERAILIVNKVRSTPPLYPRIYREIKRQPL